MCKIIHSTNGACRNVNFCLLPRKTIMFVHDAYEAAVYFLYLLFFSPSLGSVQLVYSSLCPFSLFILF